MSEQDIHAAAERWKRVRNGEEIKDVYGMMKPDWTPAQLSADMDACDLADAYCALFDNELITEEFAASVRSSNIMLEQRNDSEWVLRMFNGSHPLLIADVVTKAQVRALLLVMRVK